MALLESISEKSDEEIARFLARIGCRAKGAFHPPVVDSYEETEWPKYIQFVDEFRQFSS
jgi:hypothetical protein